MVIRFKLAKIMCFGQYVMKDVSIGNKSGYEETLEDPNEDNGPIY